MEKTSRKLAGGEEGTMEVGQGKRRGFLFIFLASLLVLFFASMNSRG